MTKTLTKAVDIAPELAEKFISEPAGVLTIISQLAQNPNVDPANVEKWLELYERLETKHREKAYKEALARLQERLPQIERNGVIPLRGGSVKYAKLEDIDLTIRPLLAEEGFSFSFGSESQDAKLFTVSATLSHREGHSETFRVMLPIDTGPGRNAVQAVASTLSYARRQLIKMALNIVERGEDQDGADLTPITEEHARDLRAFMEQVGADEKRFLKFMGVAAVEDILARDHQKAITALEQKRRVGK